MCALVCVSVRDQNRETETDKNREQRETQTEEVKREQSDMGGGAHTAWGWQAAGTANVRSAFPWSEWQSRLPGMLTVHQI